MTVQTLLDSGIVMLQVGDTVGHALYLLADEGVQHAPVLGADGRLVAIVAEADLLDQPSHETPLAVLTGPDPVFATPDTHVFDAAQLMRTHRLSVLPVATDDRRYLGAVARSDLFGQLAHMLATEESGAIVVVETDRQNYSLAQLAYFVEQSSVRVLSASVEDDPDGGVVRATLKLNVTDTARVRALMEHRGYRVVAVYDEVDPHLEDRVAAFLRYLEV